MKTKTVKLFVEGGGESNSLRTKCREAFNSFLNKAGLSGCMPRIIASGSRNNAFSDFCTAVKNGECAVMLIDSESEVILPKNVDYNNNISFNDMNPWYHLEHRKGITGESADSWKKPSEAEKEDCHLMVQVMETWFLSDVKTLKLYYGDGFNENCLPKRTDIEQIPKETVLSSLDKATRYTIKGAYNKGAHSFGILSIIDPDTVMERSIWAKRFVILLRQKMQNTES